jgi:hypothetical protein
MLELAVSPPLKILSGTNLVSQAAGSFFPLNPADEKIPIKLKQKTIFDLIPPSLN